MYLLRCTFNFSLNFVHTLRLLSGKKKYSRFTLFTMFRLVIHCLIEYRCQPEGTYRWPSNQSLPGPGVEDVKLVICKHRSVDLPCPQNYYTYY